MNKSWLKSDISALILAGGQSQRFNANDKGLINFMDKPMVQHVLERVAPQVASVSISCNRHIDQYRSIHQHFYQHFSQNNDIDHHLDINLQTSSTACIEDKDTIELQGPLAGIFAYLEDCHSELVFICSCDTPMIPRDIVQQLLNSLTHDNADVSYPVDENGHHHLALLVKPSAARAALQQLLEESKTKSDSPNRKTKVHSIRNWLNRLKSQQIIVDSQAIGFADINSATELAAIEQKKPSAKEVQAWF